MSTQIRTKPRDFGGAKERLKVVNNKLSSAPKTKVNYKTGFNQYTNYCVMYDVRPLYKINPDFSRSWAQGNKMKVAMAEQLGAFLLHEVIDRELKAQSANAYLSGIRDA